jgi:hypothetical protein
MKRLVVLVLLCGCPTPEPEIDAGTQPDGGACTKALVLGTETDARTFDALSDGSQLMIQRGPQGGWHVWVSVRASAMPQSGTLSYVLRSSSAVVSAPLRLELANLVLNPITCGWERRNDALTFEDSGETFRGSSGELELRFESPGFTPQVVKRAVQLR